MGIEFYDTGINDGNQTFGSGAPVVTSDLREGDSYIELSSAQAYIFTNGAWVLLGQIGSNYSTVRQRVTTTQTITSGTMIDITELQGFTPVADATYAVEFYLLLQATNSTRPAKITFSHPTGMDEVGFAMWVPSNNYTNESSQWGGPVAESSNSNAPQANITYGASGQLNIKAGATPGAGNVKLLVRAFTAGTAVSVRPGSWFEYWRTDL